MSDMADPKPPGTGYAVVDWRLARIEATLADSAKSYVPIEIYNMNQKNIADEFVRQRESIAEAHTAQREFTDAVKANKTEADKTRKQFLLSLAVGILVFVLSIFVQPIAKAMGLIQ